jgi:hypothetical protein
MRPAAATLAGAALLALAPLAARPLAAQVVPVPPSSAGSPVWVSLSGALYDVQSFAGGVDGADWNWGSGVQARGTVERALRRDMAVGIAGSYARLPLTATGGACNGCEGNATVWTAMGTLRLGGGGGIGFHSVFEASAGAAGFANFTRGSDPSSVPGPPTSAAHGIVPAIAAAWGAGYTLTRGLELSFVHEVGIFFYRPADGATSGSSSTPRFNATRLTLRRAISR